jgi:FeS assembly SUF system regulator
MLRISKLTDYATVIVSFLTLRPDKIVSASYIARETHLGLPTVSKILKILAEAQLVLAFRGAVGGYQLARAANSITLAEVVTAIEGDFAMTECSHKEKTCALDANCSIKDNWQVINKIIFNALSDVTLQDMLRPLTAPVSTLKGIPVTAQGNH